jgi:ABC-type nitrate/sulfonate/bicarbonate transport system substrate-binding protein
MFEQTWRHVLAVALGMAALSAPTAGRSQEMEAVFAISTVTLTTTAHFVAEDAGLFAKEGIKPNTRVLVGVASTNAVLAGSADFAYASGPGFLRAAAQGQRMLAIATLVDRPTVEFVMRKDVAERLAITDKMSIPERAQKLKGLTIGIQGVGSVVHAWERYVVARGGLDVENDVRIAPMDPPAMLPALNNKAIDGYATSLPFTTQAVLTGDAIMFASAVTDAPELFPLAYNVIYTRAEVCRDKRELCVRVGRAYAAAARMIQEQPEEVFEKVLRKRFDKMDPKLLAAAWEITRRAHAKDVRITIQQLDNAQKLSADAKLLDPKDTVKSYDGLYTDAFVK